jgi:putative nucleotidyltransferase with HDIG domain/PAS domain S-box-containing protein
VGGLLLSGTGRRWGTQGVGALQGSPASDHHEASEATAGARPKSRPGAQALRIAALYALVGAVWILSTDFAFRDPARHDTWSDVLKGLLYIAVTAGALYAIVRAALQRERALSEQLREQEAIARRASARADEERAISEMILDTIPDRIWVFTPECRIRRANAAGWRLLGREEAPDTEPTLEEAGWPEDSRALLRSHVAEVLATGRPLNGRLPLQDGGHTFIVDYSNRPITDPATGRRDVLSVAWEVTEQVRAEAALARKNRILTAIVNGLLALTGQHDRRSIAEAVTRALVDGAGFGLAWIGEVDDGRLQTLRLLAASGDLAGRLPQVIEQIRTRTDIASPTQQALQTGKASLWNDLHTRPELDWAFSMVHGPNGLRSCIVVPIRFSGRIFATLALYGRDEFPFELEELGPIEAFATQLGRALATIDSFVRYEESEAGRLAALSRVKSALIETVGALAAVVEIRDPYTAGHQQRVAAFAAAIAREKGWSEDHVEGVRIGALLHDIGKIAVPAELLNKITKLGPEEYALIKTHTTRGGELLSGIKFDWPIREMVTQHHERLDGSGYPAGIRDNEISPEAKLLAVADVAEAMLSNRPYRRSVGMDAVIAELTQGRGRLYEPESVDIALRLLREHGAAVFGGEAPH